MGFVENVRKLGVYRMQGYCPDTFNARVIFCNICTGIVQFMKNGIPVRKI